MKSIFTNRKEWLYVILLTFFFSSGSLFAQTLPPCDPPIPFDPGIDVTINCGGSIDLGQEPNDEEVDEEIAPSCTNAGQLTQKGGVYIHNFSTTGGITNISNTNTYVDNPSIDPMGPNAWQSTWFSDFTNQYVEVCAGDVFYINVTGISLYSNPPYSCRIWVDWDNDGSFDNVPGSELVYTSGLVNNNPINFSNIPITVPANQSNGMFRLRIRFKDDAPFVDSDDACTYGNPNGTEAPYGGYTGNQSGYYWFSSEIEDYSVKVSCGTNPSGGEYTYEWTPTEGLNDPYIPNPTATPTETTTYTVTITDTENDCITTAQVTITVEGHENPEFINPGPICIGETFTLPSISENGISGTWSPAINNTETTEYTFTPDANEVCATDTIMIVEVTDEVIPTFTNPGPLCVGQTYDLPTISDNGINGTWSPQFDNTQTTEYTFTPDASEGCAIETTLTVEISTEVTPVFESINPICVGQNIDLPTTSQNGINGTWTPTFDNTQTTEYTFIPDASEECASETTLTVEVVDQLEPEFPDLGPFCIGQSFDLPETSLEGISGTWSPAFDNTQTTEYTFTPDAGEECASETTLTIEIVNQITPTFSALGPFCIGQDFELPDTSIEGIFGTWSPAINNTETTEYTFTPDASEECAVETTITIEVSSEVVPTFDELGPFCEGEIFDLPTQSNNGFDGTWSPQINNTQTTEYTFTPDDIDGCASTTTLIVEIVEELTPEFSDIGPICAGDELSLPTISDNGISGTWSPEINNNQTATYIFTPSSTVECITDATLTVIVLPLPNNPNVITYPPTCDEPSTSVIDNYNPSNNYLFDPPGPTIGESGEINGMEEGVSYTVSTENNGCISEPSDPFSLEILSEPNADFLADGEGCIPLTVQFHNNSTGAVSYYWDFGDGITSNNPNPIHIYTEEGCFDVSLTVTNADGCVSTITVEDYICAYSSPDASFTMSTDEISTSESEVDFTNTSSGATSYTWYFGDGSTSIDEHPSHEYTVNENSQYQVILVAENEAGCKDTAMRIILVHHEFYFYVPNTFTPDNDNYNEVFKPVFAPESIPENYTMLIFDRWGELIFETHDPAIGWEGTYLQNKQGICQDGVYIWKIDFIKKYSGEKVERIGHVNLIR